jgi:hypothetical protein
MSRFRIGCAAYLLVVSTPLFIRSILDSSSPWQLYVGSAAGIAVGIAMAWTRDPLVTRSRSEAEATAGAVPNR